MKQNNKTIQKVLKLMRPYSFFVILSFILSILTVAFTLYAPILIGNAIDHIITKGQVNFSSLLTTLIRLGIIICLTGLLQWFMNLCNNHISYQMVRDIRSNAFEKLENLPLSYIDSHPHGDTISRIVSDVDQFSEGLLLGFTQLFSGIITIFATLLFMFSLNVKITLLVVLVTPLSLLVAGFIAKKTYKLFYSQSEIRGDLTSYIDEIIGNQKVVQAFHYQERAQKSFDAINTKLQVSSVKAIFFSSVTNPATRFINGLVYAGVGTVGAFSVINGTLTIGQLSCFLSYANQYTKPFNEISGVITELQNALASAARVLEFIETPSEIPDKKDALTMQAVDGSVSISHVSFSYHPEISLIKDFNLDVSSGQRIAIVGPTGCGKSTLINLLMRFYDVTNGKIIVSGFDIKDMKRDSLRSNYGMVLQETWLKFGTIKDNISYGKPNATLEEIITAAKSAHAHSFIKRMPNGYDTIISEDGGNLSQGQKQLLCIARVMLTLPPMLILDEATSSIDTRTEVKIQQAFEIMMKGRTSFIVAHRLSTIKNADIILVMKDGAIIEQGNHNQLLDKQGFYFDLYHSQFQSS